ncbi:MAG: methyltransferase domain-containing protein [Acidocella sp.]|nr:methyltransferase domain-containing protein [Acidocella sp.]
MLQHRERAALLIDRVAPVLDALAARVLDRLDDVSRVFATALDFGGRGAVAPTLRARGMVVDCADISPRMAALAGGRPVPITPERWAREDFALGVQQYDLVVASLSLHWINDLPGALVQFRRALRPGGLMLASMPVLGTLQSLRDALLAAEAEITGGASPRVSPFPTLQDCAALLQRAGFALPVADVEDIAFSYASPLALLHDLRAAGENNAVTARQKSFTPARLFPMALGALPVGPDGRVRAMLRLAVLTGWGPD